MNDRGDDCQNKLNDMGVHIVKTSWISFSPPPFISFPQFIEWKILLFLHYKNQF